MEKLEEKYVPLIQKIIDQKIDYEFKDIADNEFKSFTEAEFMIHNLMKKNFPQIKYSVGVCSRPFYMGLYVYASK